MERKERMKTSKELGHGMASQGFTWSEMVDFVFSEEYEKIMGRL